MYTREQYSKYILAVRNNSSPQKAVFLLLKAQGFRFVKTHFRQVIFIDQALQNTLMNRMLTIVLDVGDINDKAAVGHVYFKNMPCYNPTTEIVETISSVGFYPSTAVNDYLLGIGEFREESKRASYQSITENIVLSEEQWIQLGQWFFSLKTKKPSYSIVANFSPLKTVLHCAKFVDLALKTIGITEGLNAIFSRKQIKSIGKENYKIVLSQLAPSREISDILCMADTDLGPTACRALSIKQEDLREEMYHLKQTNLMRNAIELFIKKTESMEQDLSDKASVSSEEEDLPLVNPEQLAGAMRGIHFALEMQNQFSASWGGEPSFMSQASIQREAHRIMANSNAAIDQVTKMLQQRYKI